ncbi:O-acetylhomoserine aminocarboxypropyltransferase [Thalassobaculum litoreum]|uniref:O-acetylhomoserine sulfhydrylase n=1 Tax=Thalassobaculum litoreum DSM 18839 TaxID=1123362 RepID=A0A8G2BG82_9PROT|nr:O-acetylhomoserine sulfhydrylase [Thalassobaculum litoreum DSM 18839]
MAEIDPKRATDANGGLVYDDDVIRDILRDVKTIAMVGASDNWNRPSYFAMKYLQQKGYKVYPVNPKVAGAGGEILGEKAYADLSELPETVDMVDVFRNSAAAGPISDAAIEHGAKVVWMQLGVRNDEAADRAEAAGLTVIMDRCPKIEFSRLFGELGWHGFNSRVVSSKRRMPGRSDKVSKQSDVGDGFIPKGFETMAVHSGASPDPATGARGTPIYQTTAYVFDDADHAASLFNLQTFGNIYSRLSNPTVAVLEERIAALEGGRGTTCTSSGHAAQMLALFALMSPGDRFVASRRLYGGSITQFGRTFQKFDWHCDFVDAEDLDAVRAAAMQDKCKAIFAESLANPGGVITDIAALSRIAKDAGVPLIIDNTMATPYLCRPFEHGADLIVHSTTKFLSGHGNAMGGAVVDSGTFDWSQNDKFPSLSQPEPAYHGLTFYETFGDLAFTTYGHAVGLRDLGPTMAPMNAYLTITGIETLALRMERHVANAQTVAEWLEAHDKVAWVSYAGLEGNKYKQLAERYLPKGAGSVFTFGVKGGYEAGMAVVERCRLLSHLANIGDTRSLILHPASTTHRQLTEEQRTAAGAGDDVIRLSIGLETAEDIIADLERALG